MISNPLDVRKLQFYDWDDKLLGVLVLSVAIEDARPFVDFFVAVNFIHPQLQQRYVDKWAEERSYKRAQAVHDWPKRRVYVEESFYFAPVDGRLQIKHGLRYLPGEYVKAGRTFRPKETYQRLKLTEGGQGDG